MSEIVKVLEYDDKSIKCSVKLDHIKSELYILPALDDTLIISTKENKNHTAFSMNRIEERALYELLRSRNE
jgi:hypothetical protein